MTDQPTDGPDVRTRQELVWLISWVRDNVAGDFSRYTQTSREQVAKRLAEYLASRGLTLAVRDSQPAITAELIGGLAERVRVLEAKPEPASSWGRGEAILAEQRNLRLLIERASKRAERVAKDQGDTHRTVDALGHSLDNIVKRQAQLETELREVASATNAMGEHFYSHRHPEGASVDEAVAKLTTIESDLAEQTQPRIAINTVDGQEYVWDYDRAEWVQA